MHFVCASDLWIGKDEESTLKSLADNEGYAAVTGQMQEQKLMRLFTRSRLSLV